MQMNYARIGILIKFISTYLPLIHNIKTKINGTKMENKQTLIKVITSFLFICLVVLGILFLLAAPANPSLTLSRMIIGSVFIIFGIIILVSGFTIANKRYSKVIKVIETSGEKKDTEKHFPTLICQNCQKSIKLTEKLYNKEVVICERCGEEVKVPKDKLNW